MVPGCIGYWVLGCLGCCMVCAFKSYPSPLVLTMVVGPQDTSGRSLRWSGPVCGLGFYWGSLGLVGVSGGWLGLVLESCVEEHHQVFEEVFCRLSLWCFVPLRWSTLFPFVGAGVPVLAVLVCSVGWLCLSGVWW